MCVHVSEVGSAGQGLPPGEKATGGCKLPGVDTASSAREVCDLKY